jgi:hypothetical protein
VYETTGDFTNVTGIQDEYGQSALWDASTDNDGTVEMNYSPFYEYRYDQHTPTITYDYKYTPIVEYYTFSRDRWYVETRETVDDPWTVVDSGNSGWAGASVTRSVRQPSLWATNLLSTVGPQHTMPPCYPRTFDATPLPPASGSGSLSPDPEDPNSANVSFTVSVDFSVDHGGSLRNASRVNIPYIVSYYSDGFAGGGSVSGTEPQVFTTVIGTATIPSNNNSSPTLSHTVNGIDIKPPLSNLQAGQRICWTVTLENPLGTVKSLSNPGQIISNRGPARTTAPFCSNYARDEPYVKFFGGDVIAGGRFASSGEACSATNNFASARGGLKGTSVSGDPNVRFRGSGAQLAVFAIAEILGMQALAQQGTRQPTELSFANTDTNLLNRDFGGSFGSVLCANDYFAQIPDVIEPEITGGTVDVGSLDSGLYYYDTDITLTGLVPDERRIAIYVDGNVSVLGSGNRFGYANPTNWATIQAIPSLNVIVRGNIYIDNDVTQIDGVYVAQPDPDEFDTTGEIFSCALVGDALDVSSNYGALSMACRNQLRVHGSFVAKQVNLLRTGGSLRFSVPEESPSPSPPALAGEVFIYSPIVWFTEGGSMPANKKIQIDSYTSLPPAL